MLERQRDYKCRGEQHALTERWREMSEQDVASGGPPSESVPNQCEGSYAGEEECGIKAHNPLPTPCIRSHKSDNQEECCPTEQR